MEPVVIFINTILLILSDISSTLVIFTSLRSTFTNTTQKQLRKRLRKCDSFCLSAVMVYPLKTLRKLSIHKTLENVLDVFWMFYVCSIYVLCLWDAFFDSFSIPCWFWRGICTTFDCFRLFFETFSCKFILVQL